MRIDLQYNGKSYMQWNEKDLLDEGVPAELVKSAKAEALMGEVIALRKEAYRTESDPLFHEWQYDQTPEKEKAWRDKVAEIKVRYPLPTEMQPAA
ncbi:hypothetical protein NOL51_24540 [Vibrio parahaemolyticus]|uniref:hypothetical protein n=1 Tax=Vibrio parahaemolyticus TaxID=670 RepID=UPI002269F403|nr:hypothetical protein [Vibrio parahaemolyticus]MCX8936236.1 hypothetical protein [Vibrio parahaemolyticus]